MNKHIEPSVEGISGIVGPDTIGLLEGLLENCGPSIAVIDPSDRIVYANKACREGLFIGKNETPTFFEVMTRNHAAGRGVCLKESENKPWLQQALSRRTKEKYRAFEVQLMDGRWIFNTESVQPNGWMLSVSVDVTDLRASNRDLRKDRDLATKAAETDDLTGISNRRHILQLVEDFLTGVSAFTNQACVACILDIDHFKKINDQFGHQVGDEVIKGFAHKLRHTFRLCDCIGRLGGEEFFILLPNSTLDAAEAAINRIRSEVRNCGLIISKPDYPITFSAGITAVSQDDTVDQLYSRCDSALYEAKAKGRDTVCVAQR